MNIAHYTGWHLVGAGCVGFVICAIGAVVVMALVYAAKDKTDPHMPVVGEQNFEERK